jgi:hypothetical protein
MFRRPLYQDLAAVRALVAEGREAIGELDQFWLSSARHRLAMADNFLISAAGGLGGWARALTGTVALLVGVAAAALGTSALGFSTFWVVACSWVAGLLVETPVRKWTANRLSPALGRRRLDRAATSVAPGRSGDLAEVAEGLAKARTRLVSSTLRTAGSKHWRPAYLARLAKEDPTVYWLGEADIVLCQAIDYLEQYLDAETKEPT